MNVIHSNTCLVISSQEGFKTLSPLECFVKSNFLNRYSFYKEIFRMQICSGLDCTSKQCDGCYFYMYIAAT